MADFDVLILGAGPGGYVCAIRAAQLGLKVACVEGAATLGGTCLNVGCIPSKALLESSHLYYKTLHELKDHGVQVTGVSLDMSRMLARKQDVVTGITQGVEFLFKKNKITWIKGWGNISAAGTVHVAPSQSHPGQMSQTFTAKHIVIATGSVPLALPGLAFDHTHILDSTDALALTKPPKRLTVIGGGVIGLELGSVWMRLGSQVTVLEAAHKILGGMDQAVSEALQKLLIKQGMIIHLNTKFKQVQSQKDGSLMLQALTPQGIMDIHTDKVLVAVGRRANTNTLGLEAFDISCDRSGQIPVDHEFRTKHSWLYAIGDAIAGPMLAHKAEEEGIALAECLAGRHGHVNGRAIPGIVYTWPEVASVGETEESLKAQGITYTVGKFLFKANGRAKAMGESEGFVKVLADANTDRMLGVHMLGPYASEMIAEAALAFEYGASSEDIARCVHAHPTLSEAFKEAALDVDRRAIHS